MSRREVTIAQAWASYSREIMPLAASPTQWQETRRAFYAGASSMGAILSNAPDDPVLEQVFTNEIMAELAAFRDELGTEQETARATIAAGEAAGVKLQPAGPGSPDMPPGPAERLYAFFSVYPNGGEGIISHNVGGSWFPLITSQPQVRNKLKAMAQAASQLSRQPWRLVRFKRDDVLEEGGVGQ